MRNHQTTRENKDVNDGVKRALFEDTKNIEQILARNSENFYSHRITDSEYSENLIGQVNESNALSKIKSTVQEYSIDDQMNAVAMIKFDSSDGGSS